MLLRLFYFILALSTLGALSAQAQIYEPGLLVRANGDTLRGEIENGFWNEPPTFIRFRPAAGSASVLYQPRQLRAVSFTKGRRFRYEALPIDYAADTRLDMLHHGYVLDVRRDSLLAEVLVEGPTMLWRVARPGAVHYLVRRPGQPVIDLSERRYLRQSSQGTWVVTEGNNYHNQLQFYFSDCPTTREAAATVAFTTAALVELVRAYYAACAPDQPVAHSWLAQAAPRRKVSFQGGVLAGMRYHRLESPAYDLAGTTTDGGLHPFGGFYAELMQPSRTAAFYGELSLSSFRNKSLQYAGTDLNGTIIYSRFDYRALLGTARIGVRFLSPLAHDRQLVFTIGLEYNEVFAPKATITSGPIIPLATEEFVYATPTLLPNFGVGWRRQHLTLHLDGQLYRNDGDAYTPSTLLFGTNLAARLGASYRLGRSSDAKAAPASRQP